MLRTFKRKICKNFRTSQSQKGFTGPYIKKECRKDCIEINSSNVPYSISVQLNVITCFHKIQSSCRKKRLIYQP